MPLRNTGEEGSSVGISAAQKPSPSLANEVCETSKGAKLRVLVCGGRHFANYRFLSAVLQEIYAGLPFALVIHGGAPGADRLAGEWADQHGVPQCPVPAEWQRYGNRAGPVRNGHMLNLQPDVVVAFPGGPGTRDMIKQAKAAGVRVLTFSPGDAGATKPASDGEATDGEAVGRPNNV